LARLKIPCSSVVSLFLLRVDNVARRPVRHASTSRVVTSSSAQLPSAGTMCTRTVDRRDRIVFGEQLRSSSEYRSHSAQASATVALVRTMPGSVPGRA
jgi:hypothetical protein